VAICQPTRGLRLGLTGEAGRWYGPARLFLTQALNGKTSAMDFLSRPVDSPPVVHAESQPIRSAQELEPGSGKSPSADRCLQFANYSLRMLE